MHVHEQILISECNYTGTLPWWDEALDVASGDYFQSDMREVQYFGGNGSSVDNCITTGPFANRTLHMNMYGIVDTVKIGDVTKIQGGYLCYAFEY